MAYIYNLKEEKKREAADEAVFPCVLQIVPEYVVHNKNSIVLGVDVLEGIAKIVGCNHEEQQKMFGRHFDVEDELVSHISRRSIDVLKAYYRDDLSRDEWKLVVKLNLFKIQ
ncbi:hypothetical protein Ddye_009467 [Dipteronia dyeriana]|uniref:Uncharacterized protein n=1 Tax=Dipteronia dyeriana TaxID=168575 RepID=A0AAD9XBF7_9ROSI|nr:hypothetical protein Ddye_009467 [Dipteronia dyeriana]